MNDTIFVTVNGCGASKELLLAPPFWKQSRSLISFLSPRLARSWDRLDKSRRGSVRTRWARDNHTALDLVGAKLEVCPTYCWFPFWALQWEQFVGKRAAPAYDFGLGKRDFDPEAPAMVLMKRETKRRSPQLSNWALKKRFAFGLGKRAPYGFGLGK